LNKNNKTEREANSRSRTGEPLGQLVQYWGEQRVAITDETICVSYLFGVHSRTAPQDCMPIITSIPAELGS